MSDRKEVHWNPETIPLSKSYVQMYDRCPYRFKLQVIDDKEALSPEMERGRRVHATIAEVFELIDYDEVMAGNIESELRKYLPESTLTDNFVNLEKIKFESLKHKELIFPIYIEKFLHDPKLNFYGTFDCLEAQDDDSYIVIDWKSGKHSKWNERNYRFELMGYRHLIESQLKLRVREGVVFFLADGSFFGPEVPHPSTERAFFNRVRRTRERVRLSLTVGEFKKKTNSCQWCPFNEVECAPNIDRVEQVSAGRKARNDKGRMM